MDRLGRLQVAISGRIVTPAFPAGRAAHVPDEPIEVVADSRDNTSGLSFFIVYGGGNISQRRITIKSLRIEGTDVRHIMAYCHERQAHRLFRADRIEEAIDIATGEAFSPEALCHALMNRGIPIAEQRIAAMIRILVFMARCDGYTHHLEWDVIDRSVSRLTRCLIDDDRAIEELLQDARRLAPDGNDFIRALKGLTKTRLPTRVHQELRRAIGAVIEADGIQRDTEIEWAIEAGNFIDRMPTSD